jgi:outer membrane receptor protein involved in Fe transport
VKRIEIIRGPGSVLWGSNAVFGVINVITKDGSDEAENRVTTAYGNRDGMASANYLYSFTHDADVSGIMSFSTWKSDGFNRPHRSGSGSAFNQTDAANMHGNVEFPWGVAGDWPAIDKQREGYDLYAKLKIGDNNQLLARMVETSLVYPWDTWLQKNGSDLTMRKNYLEFQRRTEISHALYIDSLIYGDMLLQNRFPTDNALFKASQGSTVMQDQSNEEMAFGTEILGNLQVSEQNHLIAGVKAVRTKIGPNRDARFDSFLNVDSSTSLPHIGVESGYDNNVAVYFEDTHKFYEGKTKVFFGSRYDYDDFREEKGVFLPRTGIIQSLNDELTLKYVLNTGYLRPEAVYSKTVGVILDQTRGPDQGLLRVSKSEQIVDHDIQLRWERNRNYAAITGFYMDISNYISFDANNLPQGYKNLGDVTSNGVELEARQEIIGGKLTGYGNYSFARATLDNNRNPNALTNSSNHVLNYPAHTWNVGADWFFNRLNSLNLNLNGWASMPVVIPITKPHAGETTTLSGEMYVDVSYRSSGIFHWPLDATLSVSNVFDNTDAVGMVVNNGYWYPRGRNFQIKVSYRL